MEHRVAYRELSERARHAWETVNGLPLATREQQCHAWDILRSELPCLADDPHPGLYVLPDHDQSAVCELYLSGPELAALRVMVSWLKANDRAGRMRDLPVYPDLGEAILSQLGDGPWPGIWRPDYLDTLEHGGTLLLHPRTQASALMCLIDAALRQSALLCPTWPPSKRDRLVRLLYDVSCWLQAMQAAHEHETIA